LVVPLLINCHTSQGTSHSRHCCWGSSVFTGVVGMGVCSRPWLSCPRPWEPLKPSS